LFRLAARLPEVKAGARGGLPALVFVTDPHRSPEPQKITSALPPGTGVIYRSFGSPDAEKVAHELANIARDIGLVLLIGADADLAARVGADGVHLPERWLHRAPELRRRHRNWLLTGAAHSPRALRRAEGLGLDGALVSPVFPSRSPSAGTPLGPIRFASLCRTARIPIFALGGVDAITARRLLSSEASGFAAVDAFVHGAP